MRAWSLNLGDKGARWRRKVAHRSIKQTQGPNRLCTAGVGAMQGEMGDMGKIQLTNEKLIGNGSFGVVFQVLRCCSCVRLSTRIHNWRRIASRVTAYL